MDDKHFNKFLSELTKAFGKNPIEETTGTGSYIQHIKNIEPKQDIQKESQRIVNTAEIQQLRESFMREAHRMSQINSGGRQ